MPRFRRIEYPNAFYHVMNRGRNRENIFKQDSDFNLFLDIIYEASIKFNFTLHCYCLMNNHYHLLIETPDANLSKIMHFIGSDFVTKYNKKNDLDGSLFKSRYKAILVEKNSYLTELNRYIHRNALSITNNLKNYKWSSYPAYLNIVKAPSWLDKETTLQTLGYKNNIEKKYCQFIEQDRESEIYERRKTTPSIIGDLNFKKQVLEK